MSVKKADIKPGKIYVGKLPDSGVGEDEIKEHFSLFGTVSQVVRPTDWRKDSTPKNFCFVTFEKERVAKKLIEEGICNIGGHKIQIKKVPSRPRDQSTRGGRGGYGGGPWMNQGGGWRGQGGGWGNDGGYNGFGGQGGVQWGNDGGYGGGDKGQGCWGQGRGQQLGGQEGGTWSTGCQDGSRGGGGGKMRGDRSKGRGGQSRPY